MCFPEGENKMWPLHDAWLLFMYEVQTGNGFEINAGSGSFTERSDTSTYCTLTESQRQCAECYATQTKTKFLAVLGHCIPHGAASRAHVIITAERSYCNNGAWADEDRERQERGRAPWLTAERPPLLMVHLLLWYQSCELTARPDSGQTPGHVSCLTKLTAPQTCVLLSWSNEIIRYTSSSPGLNALLAGGLTGLQEQLCDHLNMESFGNWHRLYDCLL